MGVNSQKLIKENDTEKAVDLGVPSIFLNLTDEVWTNNCDLDHIYLIQIHLRKQEASERGF